MTCKLFVDWSIDINICCIRDFSLYSLYTNYENETLLVRLSIEKQKYRKNLKLQISLQSHRFSTFTKSCIFRKNTHSK